MQISDTAKYSIKLPHPVAPHQAKLHDQPLLLLSCSPKRLQRIAYIVAAPQSDLHDLTSLTVSISPLGYA